MKKYNERLADRSERKWITPDMIKTITQLPQKDGIYCVLILDEIGQGFDICNPVMITEDNKYKIIKSEYKVGIGWQTKAIVLAWKELEENEI